jgi:hypothetical protein
MNNSEIVQDILQRATTVPNRYDCYEDGRPNEWVRRVELEFDDNCENGAVTFAIQFPSAKGVQWRALKMQAQDVFDDYDSTACFEGGASWETIEGVTPNGGNVLLEIDHSMGTIDVMVCAPVCSSVIERFLEYQPNLGNCCRVFSDLHYFALAEKDRA